MIYPEKQRYMEDARSFQVVPVFTTIRADFETPLSIFLKVKASFLLESVERGENVGRYSIIALGRKSLLEINGHKLDISRYTAQGTVEKESFESPNPLEKVREYFKDLKATAYEGLPPFWGGAVGFLGYETVQFFEDIPVSEDETGVPDGMLVVPEILLVYDSVKRSVCAAVSTMPGENAEDAYKDALEKLESVAAALEAPLPKQHTRPDSKYTVDEKNEQPTGAPATQSGVNPVTQGEIDPATLREDESDRKVKVNYHMEKPYFLSCV
ncbi:MAG: hypothetical protein GY765_41690, partial [bacterium]|nr:hypothetical protein [bacterium]